MQAAQPTAKVYAAFFEGDVRDFIELFHRWIQKGRTDELLVDVHDYSHVHEGPGVILVAHECIYAMDQERGRLGLSYKRRRGGVRDAEEALTEAIGRTLGACAKLQEDTAGSIRFDPGEIRVGFDDRLRAPNEPATFEAMRSALEAVARKLYDDAEVAPDAAPRGPFRARIAGTAADLSSLSARL